MKLAKQQLKQIIKEELRVVLAESDKARTLPDLSEEDIRVLGDWLADYDLDPDGAVPNFAALDWSPTLQDFVDLIVGKQTMLSDQHIQKLKKVFASMPQVRAYWKLHDLGRSLVPPVGHGVRGATGHFRSD